MYNWSFLFVVLHKPTLLPSTFKVILAFADYDGNYYEQEIYTRCPKKAEHLIFVTLILENIAFFVSSDKTLSSENNDTKIIEIGWVVFDSMVISQNMVIFNFLFILVTFQSGIMAFRTSIHCCPETHWSVQTKQRENLWTAIPAVNSSHRFNKITVFQEMVVESILPNQIKWSWYHSSQKIMLNLMKSKYAIISNIKVTKIERLFGTPGIRNF